MDGNRRYARRNNKNVQQGHSNGFDALKKVSSFTPLIVRRACNGFWMDARSMFSPQTEVRYGVRVFDRNFQWMC
jgi:undecaprenyl diphosphate synthase